MFKRKIKVKDLTEEEKKTSKESLGESCCNGGEDCQTKDPLPGEEQAPVSEESQLEEQAEVGEDAAVEGDAPPAEAEDPQLTQLRAEAEANYDKYLRAVAELENYKKRILKERAELIKYAGEGLARDILDIVDQLKIALKHEGTGSAEEFMKGVRIIYDNLIQVLARHQIVGEDSLGKLFDPLKHEALATVPSEGQEPGTIIEEFKGYFKFKDKLLRPAQVVVAKEVEKPQVDEESGNEPNNSRPFAI